MKAVIKTGIALLLILGGLGAFGAPVVADESKEPSYETIDSGKCVVPVCTDIEYGNYVFRLYAPDQNDPGPMRRIRLIPKDACSCQKIETRKQPYRRSIRLLVEGRGSERGYAVFLKLIPRFYEKQLGGVVRPVADTTFERLQNALNGGISSRVRKTNEFFQFWQSPLQGYDIYRTRYPDGEGVYSYFFSPKAQTLKVKGQQQDVAFSAWNFPHPDNRYSIDELTRRTFEPGSSVRLFPDMLVGRTFRAIVIPPDSWIAEFEKTIGIVEDRLTPKPQQ